MRLSYLTRVTVNRRLEIFFAPLQPWRCGRAASAPALPGEYSGAAPAARPTRL